MKYRFTIPNDPRKNYLPHHERMPSLNQFIHAERQRTPRGFTKGAVMKKEWQKYVVSCIRKQLRVKIKKPICVHYYYYEQDIKRDIGNVHAFCQKVVEDALQDCAVIPNDNQYYIPKFTADFYIDPVNPRVEVVLEELDYGTKV